MTSLEGLAVRLREFARERDWEQFHTPKNLAMAVAGEAGELLAEFQWLTAEESAGVMEDAEKAHAVRSEMADVLIYLVRMADLLDFDLVAAANTKLTEAEARYPTAAVQGSARKAASNVSDRR